MNFIKASFLFLGSITVMSAQAQEAVKLNLKQSIEYGLQYHPSVQIFENNIGKSKQAAREAVSAYLPQVNVQVGLDDNLKLPQTIIPAGTFGPGTPEQRVAFGTQFNSSMSVQLDQTIYNQSLIHGIKASKPNTRIAVIQEMQNEEDIIYNISVAYYQIIIAEKQKELLETNKSRLERILEVTELQATQGVAKKVDIKQVQVNVNNVTAQLSVIEKNLQLAKNSLKFQIGLDQNLDIIITDTERWLELEPQIKHYPEFDFQRNLQFQLLEQQIELYDINVKVIRDQALPTLGVYARYGANGFGEEFNKAFDPLLDFSTIGIKLSWNIFTGLRRDAQFRSAKLDAENARLNQRLTEQSLSLQYQNADAQVNRAQTTILTNKNNMDLATEVYENTGLQYREGLASLSDLLNAELSYREAQNNYITSLLDYYMADLDVERANGTLENYFNNL